MLQSEFPDPRSCTKVDDDCHRPSTGRCRLHSEPSQLLSPMPRDRSRRQWRFVGRRNPRIGLRLFTNNNRVDVAGEGLDYAIRFGDGLWHGTEATHLIAAPFTPLCAPALAHRLTRPAELKREALLRSYRKDEWTRWFDGAGLCSVRFFRERSSIHRSRSPAQQRRASAWRCCRRQCFRTRIFNGG